MASNAELSPKPRRRRRRGWLIALAVVVGASAAWAVWTHVEEQELARMVADLQAQGYPVTRAQAAPAPVPPALNAWLIYDRVFFGPEVDAREKTEMKYDWRQFDGDTPRDVQALRAFLAEPTTRQELEQLRQAAQLPDCVIPNLDSSEVEMDFFLYPSYLRRAAIMADHQAKDLIRQGRLPEAFVWMQVGLGTADHCAAIPGLTSWLSAWACQALELRELRTVINDDIPASTSASVRDYLLAVDQRDVVRRGLIYDRAVDLDLWRAVQPRFSWPPWRKGRKAWAEWAYSSPPWRPWVIRDEIAVLQMEASQIALAGRPWPEVATQAQALDAAAEARGYGPELETVPLAVNLRIRDQSTARLQTCGLFLAAKAYKHDRGAYPDSLDQLAQYLHRTLPLDPFTGQSYGYARQGQGFAVTVPGEPLRANDKPIMWKCDK
jgi:hypothetical protein